MGESVAAMTIRCRAYGRKAVDHRSHRIEAHAEEILALVDETPDITLGEIDYALILDAGQDGF